LEKKLGGGDKEGGVARNLRGSPHLKRGRHQRKNTSDSHTKSIIRGLSREGGLREGTS